MSKEETDLTTLMSDNNRGIAFEDSFNILNQEYNPVSIEQEVTSEHGFTIINEKDLSNYDNKTKNKNYRK